jgi:uncharacterized protein YbjT (DUF2867 family)
MSRIVVVGGNGRTGKLIVQQLLKNGDAVVATIRNPKHIAPLVKLGAETVMLDLDSSSPRDFSVAFTGSDAIVFAAGSGEGESSAIDRKGVIRTVNAAAKAGVKRYVAVSALGASTPVPDQWNTPDMKEYWSAKRAGNKKILSSSLDWTIIEPGELTEGKPAGKIAIGENGIDVGKISRADVAAAVVAALATPKSAGHIFQIVGGRTPVDEAITSASEKKAAPAKKPAVKKPAAKKPAARKKAA